MTLQISNRFMSQNPIWGADGSQHMDRIETVKFPDPRVLADLGASVLGWKITQGAGAYGFEDRTWRRIWQIVREINANGMRMARLPFHFLDYADSHYTEKPELFGASQARYCWSVIKPDPGEIQLHLDFEPYLWGPINWLTAGRITKIAMGFLKEYDQLSGALTDLYTSPGMLRYLGDGFKDRDLWLAWYNELRKWVDIDAVMQQYGWRGICWMWQYASDGDLDEDGMKDGIMLGMEELNLDLNVSPLSAEEFSRFCGNSPAPATLPAEDQPAPVPVPAPVEAGRTKVIELMKPLGRDGLNIRPVAMKPSTVTGWIPAGKEVEILEQIKNGADTWARVGQGQFAAIEYLGVKYLG